MSIRMAALAGLLAAFLAPPAGAAVHPVSASFLDAKRGWVLVQNGCQSCAALRRTDDGGASWQKLPPVPVSLGLLHRRARSVTHVYLADADTAYLWGPALELTRDGGRTWIRSPLPPVEQVTGGGGRVFALSDSSGRVRLWRNRVGSVGWAPVTLPHAAGAVGAELRVQGSQVVLLDRGTPLAGGDAPDEGELWLSGDGGASWARRSVPCRRADGGASAIGAVLSHPREWLLDCFDDRQSSQALFTRHTVYWSADAGRSWRRLAVAARNGVPSQLAGNGSGHLFLATESGSGDHLVGSLDGGRSWSTLVTSGGDFFDWADLQFVSPSTGFIVGPTHYAPQHLFRTNDGGRSWKLLAVR